uniref:tyrosyl-DNA phosphodiesterase 2 n=1 Tax=Ictidomys tridecemlineatus TaxID=43179 RepID=UPI001A9E315F|nr:tyrosyl-DNA phosphodiesterase 2 [Ictidomys tridecemlineatus]
MEREDRVVAAPDEGEPEGKRRRLLCEDFASVARCDAGVAQCYLAENDWEMERALHSYFEPPVEESAEEGRPGEASPPAAW